MIWPTNILRVESWILVVSSILLVRYYFHKKWNVLKQWNIPHDPPSLCNLGNVRAVFSEKFFTYQLECKRKFGPIWGFYCINQPRVVVHDLEIIHRICIKEFSNFQNRVNVCALPTGKECASGLLSVNDDQWKRSRNTLTPAFSSFKLKKMVDIVNHCVDNTVKNFEDTISNSNGEFVPKDVFARLAFDTVCSTTFSIDINSQDPAGKDLEFMEQAKAFADVALLGVLNVAIVAFPFLERFCVWLGGLRKSVVYFNAACKELMNRKSEDLSSVNHTDLMHLMLESRISESQLTDFPSKGLTSTEIIGNTATMLLAGYETTSNSMNFLSYNLAFHPEVQSKLQAEIDEMHDNVENPTIDMINELKFLDMCINENLRLYCPVPRTVRTAKNEITVSGLTIPKGCVIEVPIYALAHDPEFWDEPMEFKPERMRNLSKINTMAFLPFGLGPRNCIGSKYAMMEIKLAFVKILRRFSFKPTRETPKPPLSLLLRSTTHPKINYKLQVLSRT